jgi:hypothetical protein
MATIPSRMKRLKENIPSILNQRYPFDLFMINILDNLSEEDYAYYEELAKMDNRIVLNKVEQKWRSCNKLIPALKLYPDDVIITVDDDIYYPKDCIGTLMQQWLKTPSCIIAHEVNPILLQKDNTYVTYLNGYDIKLMQKEWGKYLSCCTLFPPHTFDGTEVFDYEKMMEFTQGTHDELWFWIQSTLNGVMCVGLNYVKTFMPEVLSEWEEGEFRLADINLSNDKIEEYMDKINEVYGERLISMILSKKPEFLITKDNIYSFLYTLPWINTLYGEHYKILYSGLTKGWIDFLKKAVLGEKVKY